MSTNFALDATTRTTFGKAESRRMRRQNQIPGIIYGTGGDPVTLTFNEFKVNKALDSEAFYSSILTINVDGKPEKAVLKALQRHPAKRKIVHMDFQRVSATEKLTMRVPIHFVGADEAPGVKQEGGIVSHNQSDVEIRCLPGNLPEFLEIDLTNLGLEQSLHLSDLKLPSGVEIVELTLEEPNNMQVAAIHLPRAAVEEEVIPAGEQTPEGEVPTVGEEAKAQEDKSEE